MELTYQEWVEKYHPKMQQNSDPQGYETYDNDMEYIRKQDPHTIWTLIDDGQYQYITNGLRVINRQNYLITDIPWKDEDFITVILEE